MFPIKHQFLKFSLPSILSSALLLASAVLPASAFQLRPMSRVFAPSGNGSTQSYDIVNDSDEPLAVELSVMNRQMDLDGAETQTAADDDFLIYPSQIVLNPGETQTVRVTWLGDPQPTTELAYRLVAAQVPVELGTPQTNETKAVGAVKVMLRYLGSVYIHPENTAPKVVLDSITPRTDANGTGLEITLNNQGNARAFLKNFRLHLVSSTGTPMEVTPEQLKDISNTTILAGHQRRYFLLYPDAASVNPTSATFEFDSDS